MNNSRPLSAFLSHSSKDKRYADLIAGQFSSANLHYDAKTFEQGEQSSSEIFEALSKCDVFTLLLSQNSIDSKWVQAEIATSQHRFFGGQIKKIIVFVLDDLPSSRIPEWLRMFVHRRSTNVAVISNVIRSALIELERARNPAINIFIGRDTALNHIKAKLADVSASSPQAIFVAGWDGIGRRTLIRRAMADVFSSLVAVPVEVTLRRDQGDIELYRDLISKSGRFTFTELIAETERYSNLALHERIQNLATELDALSEDRQMLIVRGSDALIGDDGDLKEWLTFLLRSLGPSTWPKLALISQRILAPGRQTAYQETLFVQVNSLSREESRTLLSLLLKHKKIAVSGEFLTRVIDAVNGHPYSITTAAAFIEQAGIARVIANPGELVATLSQPASQLLEQMHFTHVQERVLAIFREYEILSAEDLLSIMVGDNATEVGAAVSYLQDFGVLESEAEHLRLAPFLIDAAGRHRMSIDSSRFLSDIRTRMIDRVSEFVDSDVIKIQTVDSVVLSALRMENSIDNPLLARALLPSHLLRVAREQYDQRRYARAAELAERAFDSRSKLSIEAQVEAMRIAALSYIHHGALDAQYLRAKSQLESLGVRLAMRVGHFITGVKLRAEGDIAGAEKEFLTAYRLGGDRSYHILRQLASIYLLKEEYGNAEKFARLAVAVAPASPYVLDVLVRILIDVHWNDSAYLTGDPNFLDLLEKLERLSSRERKSFYEVRQGQLKSALRDKVGAIEWAEKAATMTPGHPGVLLQLAKIQLDQKMRVECGHTLDAVARITRGSQGEDKRWRTEYDKLLVNQLLDGNDFDGATGALGRARSMPQALRDSLSRRIDAAKAYQARA